MLAPLEDIHAGVLGSGIVGPERIGIVGRNGAGKTTLLRSILGSEWLRVPVAYLPQRLDILADSHILAEAVSEPAPGSDKQEVRAHLARLLFRGRTGDKLIGSLSGGERLRAALAIVLFRRPAPQLLILAEPTNNLDLDSVESLAEELADWPRALVIVSHHDGFRERVGVGRRIQLRSAAQRSAEPGGIQAYPTGRRPQQAKGPEYCEKHYH